jgi:hypothetical protein
MRVRVSLDFDILIESFISLCIIVLEFLIDNIFVSFGGTVSAGRRHTNGYELCPSSSLFLFSNKYIQDQRELE